MSHYDKIMSLDGNRQISLVGSPVSSFFFFVCVCVCVYVCVCVCVRV